MRAEGLISIAALAATTVLFAACGSSTGGGFATSYSGGAEGQVCYPANQTEGCFYKAGNPAQYQQMVCDATSSQWTVKGVCPAGTTCVESGVQPKTTECKAPAVTPDTTGGDTTAGDTTGGDTKTDTTTSPTAIIACLKSTCPTQYAACKAAPGCSGTITCAEGCTTEACADACPDFVENDQAALALVMCGMSCFPTEEPDNCGNGTCDADESNETCSIDCPATNKCGNGTCDAGESNSTCPSDCPAANKCGNGTCDSGESNSTCPSDCPATNKCGNGTCDAGESNSTCPSDCPSTSGKCGDLTCQSGEASSCLVDCSPEAAEFKACAGGKCASQWQACAADAACIGLLNCAAGCGENESCQSQCFSSAPSASQNKFIAFAQCYESMCTTAPQPTCGDGKCEAGETQSNCAADCGGTGSEPGCTAKSGPGCPGCPCGACVCAMDSYCCETAWDDQCAGECKNDCGGNCN